MELKRENLDKILKGFKFKEKQFEIEFEKNRTMLEFEEENNMEYKEVIDKIKNQYERMQSKSFDYIEKLKNSGMTDFEWFFLPPVLTRTDLGYNSDIDIVVIYDEDKTRPKIIQENIIDGVFFMPDFISIKDLKNKTKEFPQIMDWYLKKTLEKKENKNNKDEFIDLYEYEDQLRYSLGNEKREKIREYRLKLAEFFIETAKKDGIKVEKWDIEGSTKFNKDKFSVCSDLDLDIDVKVKDNDEESKVIFYFNNYLKYKFKEKYGVKIDFHVKSLKMKNMLKN